MKKKDMLALAETSLLNILNIGGVLLIMAGIAFLPIHFSFKLMIEGIAFLLAWYTYTR